MMEKLNIISLTHFIVGLYPALILFVSVSTPIFKDIPIKDVLWIISFLVIPLIVFVIGMYLFKVLIRKELISNYGILIILTTLSNSLILVSYCYFLTW